MNRITAAVTFLVGFLGSLVLPAQNASASTTVLACSDAANLSCIRLTIDYSVECVPAGAFIKCTLVNVSEFAGSSSVPMSGKANARVTYSDATGFLASWDRECSWLGLLLGPAYCVGTLSTPDPGFPEAMTWTVGLGAGFCHKWLLEFWGRSRVPDSLVLEYFPASREAEVFPVHEVNACADGTFTVTGI